MLRNYSKIDPSMQALKTGPIVLWKGEKQTQYYVEEIFVD